MTWSALVHDDVWKDLTVETHGAAREAMRALVELKEPARGANVRPVNGSAYEQTHRLRVGRHRILFIVFPDEKTIVFTTAFLKRRDSDYAKALERHESRVRAFE